MSGDTDGRTCNPWRDICLQTVEFPSFANGKLAIDRVLEAFLQLEGVGWDDYCAQRARSNLDLSDRELASKLLLFQKLGLLTRKSDNMRLTGFGYSLYDLHRISHRADLRGRLIAEESHRLLRTLRTQTVQILSRYRLPDPSDPVRGPAGLSASVMPFQCVWRVMLSLGGMIHPEELERVVFNITDMRDIGGAVEKIESARLQLDDYAGCSDTDLASVLGQRCDTGTDISPIDAFCFSGWRGLAVCTDSSRDGFYRFIPESENAITEVLKDPPRLSDTVDPRDWPNLYSNWNDARSVMAHHLGMMTHRCLESYRANPLLVEEHYNIERSVAQGGYGHRQLYELVQNGADALRSFPQGLIHVVLTDSALYCANEGEPFKLAGIDSILTSHVSDKIGAEIGRFGLGFKAVLGVTTKPEVYSRSVSFVFDRSKAEELIRSRVANTRRSPVLRIAFAKNPYPSDNTDPVLRELMKWADTVVRLPLDVPNTSWIAGDVAEFPAEFMLFCEHVGTLVLENRTTSTKREIVVKSDGDTVDLEEGDNSRTRWRVFKTLHRPSAIAQEDAGELAKRDEVPLAWAVPLDAKDAQSEFWAFFPTEQLTKLSGILNAPWKTNEDRQNLLQGIYNSELLNEAAKLVVNNLDKLATPDDPAKFLDYLPGRADEYLNWADHELNMAVYRIAAESKCVPDMDKTLRVPSDIKVHPDGMGEEALELWSDSPHRPSHYCHPSCVKNTTRRARVERLTASIPNRMIGTTEWLESLVTDRSWESSLNAVRIAAAVIESSPSTAIDDQVSRSRILLTEGGELVCPDPCTVFIKSQQEVEHTDVTLVHPGISGDDYGRKALGTLGITDLSSVSLLQAFLAENDLEDADEDLWSQFWRSASNIRTDQAKDLIRQHFEEPPASLIRVRTVSGGFRPINETLIPGKIVQADGRSDSAVAIDETYHAGHMELIRDLGGVEYPQRDRGLKVERWFHKYECWAKDSYYREAETESRPQWDKLGFSRDSFVGPITPILELSDTGKVSFTRIILDCAAEHDAWTMRHETRADYYPRLAFPAPHIWMIREHGMLDTSLGPAPVSDCVAPAFGRWSRLFPVVSCSPEDVSLLEIPSTFEELTPDRWGEALREAESMGDMEYLAAFYCFVSDYLATPGRIRCLTGSSSTEARPGDVIATDDKRMRSVLEETGLPFICTEHREDLERILRNWRLRSASSVVHQSVEANPSGSSVAVTDKFLGLSSELRDDQVDLQLLPCSFIRRIVTAPGGTRSLDCDIWQAKDFIYFSDRLNDDELLDAVIRLLGLSLSPEKRGDIVDQHTAESTRKLMITVSEKGTLEEKLLEAVGLEALVRKLHKPVLDIALGRFGELNDHPVEVARLAMAVHGVEILKLLQCELQQRGLSPPRQWARSYHARKFVREMGFPEEYAGFRGSRRESVMEVEGPRDLPGLHDFQVRLCSNIRSRIESPTARRGLLSLPTGAGKTRIAVQALVEAVKEGAMGTPILWVAQSDELCEQAVQTWGEVWRSVGSGHTLQINRLWAQNEADICQEGSQLVVATIDKLQICFGKPDYDWLKEIRCLVIDEAHTAVTSEFGRLFRFLEMERGKDRCPVIGLTATPYKGNEELTRLLAGRFQSNRLDYGVFDTDNPYPLLQDMKILARAEHQLLPHSGAIDLSSEEEEHLRRFDRLAPSTEGRIGEDSARNSAIIQAVRELPGDWPVLLFATSVEHAHVMAALLNWEGISAMAISANTEAGARRYYIEQFRSGRLRVLTNYGVLTAGFDAPAIRAVFITRPTFTPGLYLQMVGRGLRGPKNGGKEECLIVDVEDNFRQYGKELAFTEFEYIWK